VFQERQQQDRISYESAWKSFKATQVPGFADDPITIATAITRTHLTGFVVALRESRAEDRHDQHMAPSHECGLPLAA